MAMDAELDYEVQAYGEQCMDGVSETGRAPRPLPVSLSPQEKFWAPPDIIVAFRQPQSQLLMLSFSI